MIELIIAVGIVTFTAGTYLGWWLAQRAAKAHDHQHVHVQEIGIDDAIEIIEYLQARNRHPSNQRFRHPEMEEEDDC